MKRPQKITFGEMRATGTRGLLVYCRDYKCSHMMKIPPEEADKWPDDLRLIGYRAAIRLQGLWPARRQYHGRSPAAQDGNADRLIRIIVSRPFRRIWHRAFARSDGVLSDLLQLAHAAQIGVEPRLPATP